MRLSVVLPVMLIIVIALSSASLTINQASSLAQKEMKSSAPPTSDPGIPSIVDDNTYFVMEFGDSWIPVDATNEKVIKEFDDDAFKAVYLHQLLQLIKLAKKNDGYPSNLQNNLAILQGNVESKIIFYQTYASQMPAELKPYVTNLTQSAKVLDSQVNKTISDIAELKNIEDYMLTVSVSPENETEWRSQFKLVLDDISDMIVKAYSFENVRNEFVQKGALYVQNESNDVQTRGLVANFIAGSSVDGIPSSLPNYKNIVSDWNSWLSTVMSPSSVSEKAKTKFASALDNFNMMEAKRLKLEAYAKVSATKTTFETIRSRIGGCLDDLRSTQRKQFELAEEYYNKSISAYNKGSIYLNQSNYTLAVLSFQDAIGWSEKNEPILKVLSNVSCPPEKPAIVQQENPLVTFLKKNWIGIVALIVILIGVYLFFSNKPGKGRKQLEEYALPYDESYGESLDYGEGGPDINDLFS